MATSPVGQFWLLWLTQEIYCSFAVVGFLDVVIILSCGRGFQTASDSAKLVSGVVLGVKRGSLY